MELKDNPNLVVNPILEFKPVCFYEQVANEKAGKVGMQMASIHGMTGGVLVEIKNTTTYKRGPRKGEFKYLKDGAVKVLVSEADYSAAKAKWVAETGRCLECFGNKLYWVGWSADKGNYFAPCKSC